MKNVAVPLDRRFALIDFCSVDYEDDMARPEEPMMRYQAILVDRQFGWAKMNGVRLHRTSEDEGERQAKLAWSLLCAWAEQTALGRFHPGRVDTVNELPGHQEGGMRGCAHCDEFFRWVKADGFGSYTCNSAVYAMLRQG